jgi:hypothetical protein
MLLLFTAYLILGIIFTVIVRIVESDPMPLGELCFIAVTWPIWVVLLIMGQKI